VTLWSGVSPGLFRTMTVTVQPAADDAAAAGRRVLRGLVRAR
jgi:hypothetical protein